MTKAEREERKKLLESKIERLKAEIKKAKNQKRKIINKDNLDNRKIDKRKKILIGAMVLYEVKENRVAKSWLNEKMDKFLSRTDERQLFGLEPIPEIVKQENERKAKREALKSKKKAEELAKNANLQEVENDLAEGQ